MRCFKRLISPGTPSLEAFYTHVISAPSLHRASTDALIPPSLLYCDISKHSIDSKVFSGPKKSSGVKRHDFQQVIIVTVCTTVRLSGYDSGMTDCGFHCYKLLEAFALKIILAYLSVSVQYVFCHRAMMHPTRDTYEKDFLNCVFALLKVMV